MNVVSSLQSFITSLNPTEVFITLCKINQILICWHDYCWCCSGELIQDCGNWRLTSEAGTQHIFTDSTSLNEQWYVITDVNYVTMGNTESAWSQSSLCRDSLSYHHHKHISNISNTRDKPQSYKYSDKEATTFQKIFLVVPGKTPFP